jgi:hypothetical protein
MSLTPDQAADSLNEITRTGRRSAQAFGYASASPYFILWGVIWMVGYTGSDIVPHSGGPLWTGLTVLGGIGCAVIGRRQAAARGADGRASGVRMLATMAVIFVFMLALFAVIGRPANPMASAAIAPLVVAMFYALLGIWRGIRFMVAGAVVAALTLAGLFYLPQHFLLWMAAVGGGSMVLVGLWLRKI